MKDSATERVNKRVEELRAVKEKADKEWQKLEESKTRDSAQKQV